MWRSGRPGKNLVDLNDGALDQGASTDKQLISNRTVSLEVSLGPLVLLVDFLHREHARTASELLRRDAFQRRNLPHWQQALARHVSEC